MKKLTGIALLALLLCAAGAYPSKSNRLEGIIINVTDTAVELKRGRKEFTFKWAENSRILLKGKDAQRDAVQVCQKARVEYVPGEDGDRVVALEIVRESYCVR